MNIEIPPEYSALLEPIRALVDRVTKGKGKQRHQDFPGQTFMNQDICVNFSHAGRVDQIRKKAKESLKFKSRQKAMNEILDVMGYACAEWLVLYFEEMDAKAKGRDKKQMELL